MTISKLLGRARVITLSDLGISVRKMNKRERRAFVPHAAVLRTKVIRDVDSLQTIMGTSELLLDPFTDEEKLRDCVDHFIPKILNGEIK